MTEPTADAPQRLTRRAPAEAPPPDAPVETPAPATDAAESPAAGDASGSATPVESAVDAESVEVIEAAEAAESTEAAEPAEGATPSAPATTASGKNKVIAAGDLVSGGASVEEGITIAHAAARLGMKNHILMDILGSGGEFSRKRYLREAMQILTDLADESDNEVAYLDQMIKRARSLGFKSTGMHDYRRGDIANLKHRKENAETVAADLRRRSTDEGTLNTLVSVAQQAAWREVARNIEFNLDSEFAQVPEGVDEPGERADRISEVIRLDLPRLERDQKRLQRRARAQAAEAERKEAAEAKPKPKGLRGLLKGLRRR
ncbi:hypothetical protein [Gulosibacter massiliensis]|uniref:hypothetical protein n=1 Tax=Gulosibacter massiliensis TaxID=2479839 RepID=UPI000F63A1D5|nr:hypothetical protein [Gulosibacter massiliensis]